jgi:hypothetical protein
LDLVPGAAAAYSLRSLSRSYAGPVVTVRRSSDDAEEDFTAADVSDGTLAAFCGAGDGLVKQWWDQSGNANHGIQATALSQPSIVSAGAVVTVDGKPAVLADSSVNNQFLSVAGLVSFDLTTDFTKISLMKATTGNNRDIGFGSTTSGLPLSYVQPTASTPTVLADLRTDAGTLQRINGTYNTDLNLFFYQCVSTISLFQNGVLQGTVAKAAGSITIDNVSLMATESQGGTFQGGSGYLLELILYSSDLSSQRELIEGNIAWSYSV